LKVADPKVEGSSKDDVVFIIEDSTTTIPERRRKVLQAFPQIIPGPEIPDDQDSIFTREFLKNTLGGCIIPLIVKYAHLFCIFSFNLIHILCSIAPAKASALAKKHHITKFLVPRFDHNPWCPSSPGEHGYMFVGLGNEADTFLQPETLNLFVSKKGTGTRLSIKYLGVYVASRVDPLELDEWSLLPYDVRLCYPFVTSPGSQVSSDQTDLCGNNTKKNRTTY
jgi:hypothetical protein